RSETCIAAPSAKEENFLARRMDSVGQQLGKEFWQPGSASENKTSGRDVITADCRDRFWFLICRRWLYGILQIVDAVLDRFAHDQLNGTARHQHATVRLQHGPCYSIQSDLRVTMCDFACG